MYIFIGGIPASGKSYLAKKDFIFPGIFLLGGNKQSLLLRNKKNPRWGQTEKLQRKEAEGFL